MDTTSRINDQLDLSDCTICGGPALLEEESGHGYYIMCMDCGSHSVNVDFRNDDERITVAKKVAQLWNSGKIISSDPGE